MIEFERIRTRADKNRPRVKTRSSRQFCDGSKLVYRCWHGAERAARRMRRHKHKDGGRVAVYRCESCRGYHIGSAPAWELNTRSDG
jgi:predicted SprT family Zn-dependent metalloprotease